MKRLAVLGHPVAHSRSPAMQNAALAELGLREEWSYEAIDVPPQDFEAQVRGMAAEGFAGANVTVPHKGAAFLFADETSEGAARIGAANTLVFAAGKIQAHNTDAGGLIASLPDSPRGVRALVLGAGGAARAAIWALRSEGAAVDIWNRTVTKAQQVHVELGGALSVRDTAHVRDELEIELDAAAERDDQLQIAQVGGVVVDFDQSAYDLIVNTTALGLQGEDPFEHVRPLRPDGFSPRQTVVDMVYAATPSALLSAAREAGAPTVDGIEILVQQGALSFEIWTGRKPPLDVMRAAAYSLGER